LCKKIFIDGKMSGYKVTAKVHGRHSYTGKCAEEHSFRRGRGGSPGNRHHYCVNTETNYNGGIVGSDDARSLSDDLGENPCRDVGESSILAGGTNSNGNDSAYDGREANYSSAPAALQCDVKQFDSSTLTAWSDNIDIQNSTAKDNDGITKNIWEQIVDGIRTPLLSQAGYCDELGNLAKVIKHDNTTCYGRLLSHVARAKGVQYCESNPESPECSCINVAKGVTHCLDNPQDAGCERVIEGYNKFPEKAKTLFNVKNFQGNCFHPDACGENSVYAPSTGLPAACQQQIQVCEQTVNATGVSGGTVNIDQLMECENNGGPADGGDDDADTDDDDDDDDDAFNFDISDFIPKSITDFKEDQNKQIGTATSLISCSCCMFLVMTVVL
jgi:hypothetical protein